MIVKIKVTRYIREVTTHIVEVPGYLVRDTRDALEHGFEGHLDTQLIVHGKHVNEPIVTHGPVVPGTTNTYIEEVRSS